MATSGLILVTGASGFLGRHLCEHLAANGSRVRGLVRTAGPTLPSGVEIAVVSDLLDRDGVRDAVAGAGVVVHLAARAHVMRDSTPPRTPREAGTPDATPPRPLRAAGTPDATPPRTLRAAGTPDAGGSLDAFRRVNVEGTRVLTEEALRAGVSTFIFASSVKAVGEGSQEAWTDEVTPAPVDPYGVSKLEAEQLLETLARETRLRVAVLRLPLVYGPGMKGNMLRLFELVDTGYPLPFGLIANRRALVYCGNVVAAIETAMTAPDATDRPFFVSDGADLSTPALVRAIARALGRPVRLVPVPPALMRLAGRAGDLLSRVVPSPITTADVERLSGSLSLDTSRFARVTGYRPPYDLTEGLAATARWYRSGRGRLSSAAPRVRSRADGRDAAG